MLIEFLVGYTVKHQSTRFSDLLALDVTAGMTPLSVSRHFASVEFCAHVQGEVCLVASLW